MYNAIVVWCNVHRIISNNMGILPDPKNQLNKLPVSGKNPLGSGLPSIASSTNLPTSPKPGGEDPCSSTSYLKNKLSSMPIVGNMSLSDLAPNINLDEITAPKIPSVKDITSGVSNAINDAKDSIGKSLDNLKPSNLIPDLKKQAGIAGREALAGAIESAMMDALGPVKGGIGDRITRSVKQNLMMAGISEVANIISGEPNIFDPCAGKNKSKSNATLTASMGEVGRLNNDINKSINSESTKFAAQSNRNARDIIPPVKKPAIPQIGSQPPLPAGNDSNYTAAVEANRQANEQVADNAIKDVSKKTATKQAQTEYRKDQESAAQEQGITASGEHFAEMKKPGSKYHYLNSTIIGPQSGWSSSGTDNSDIISTINTDLESVFMQSLDTRSDAEPVVTGSVSAGDLDNILYDIHNLQDVEQQFYDYQSAIDLEPRHYMIWAKVKTTSNGIHITGAPKITVDVDVYIFRTCDECGAFGNYTYHKINVTRTALGESPIEAYKNAVRGAITAEEFQNKLTNELISIAR